MSYSTPSNSSDAGPLSDEFQVHRNLLTAFMDDSEGPDDSVYNEPDSDEADSDEPESAEPEALTTAQMVTALLDHMAQTDAKTNRLHYGGP